MNWFLRLSIRSKLTLIILLVTLVAVTVGSVAALMFELQNAKQGIIREAVLIANTVGSYSATDLAFRDKKAAKNTLLILQDTPNVINAHLYDEEGKHFVSLKETDVPKELRVDRAKVWFEKDELHVYKPIDYEGSAYGVLHLVMSSRPLDEAIRNQTIITVGIALIVLLLAFGLAASLQSLISRPIRRLTEISKRISQQPSYSLRASTNLQDEVGTLYAAFNEMLEQVKRREVALQQSEEKWRSLTQYSPDHIIMLDQQGRVQFINHTVPELGIDDVIGRPIYDFVPPQFRQKMAAVHEQVFRTGEPAIYVTEFHGHDGVRHFEGLVGPVTSDDRVVSLIVNTRDISERKKSELEKTRALKRLEILHAIDAAILKAQSPRAIAMAALEQFEELVHTDRSSVTLFDLHAKQVYILAHRGRSLPSPHNSVLPLSGPFGEIDVLREGEVNIIENLGSHARSPLEKSLHAAGVNSYVNVPLVINKELIGTFNLGLAQETISFNADEITIASELASVLAIAIQQARLNEQVKLHAEELEKRVTERTAALEAANRELESFSYSVSHDLRAPLRSMDGFSQAVMEDYADKLDATGRDYLGRVRKASQRMGQLIDDLLTLSRINRSVIKREKIDMVQIARDVMGSLHQTDPDRQVEFVVHNQPVGYADPQLVRVVLENLLGNAWKFTAKQPQARIEIGSDLFDHKVAFYVRDNGAGFDMNYAGKLFGAFQRLHGDLEFEGTGIGLASVQRIIHRHGGEVWALGEVGRGATFYFTLGTGAEISENHTGPSTKK
jgi:PAS domain S-box-containing protein